MIPFEITFDPDKHQYWIDGDPVPSVTQVLGVLSKPALPWWGMTTGVDGVCQLQRAGEEIPWDDPDGVVKLLTYRKLTVNHVKKQAGTRGSSIHTALEQYMKRGRVPNAVEFPEEDAGYVMALAKALLALNPQPLDMEVVVGSRKHGYAGRFDLLAEIDGIVTRLDLKTGKAVYPEAMLQLAAYEGAAAECGMAPSNRRVVLRLDAGGEFEVVESCATLDEFLGVLAAWKAMRALRDRLKRAKAHGQSCLA